MISGMSVEGGWERRRTGEELAGITFTACMDSMYVCMYVCMYGANTGSMAGQLRYVCSYHIVFVKCMYVLSFLQFPSILMYVCTVCMYVCSRLAAFKWSSLFLSGSRSEASISWRLGYPPPSSSPGPARPPQAKHSIFFLVPAFLFYRRVVLCGGVGYGRVG